MKSISVILLSALLTLTLSAQGQTPQKAQELVSKVSQKLQAAKTLQADFSFTLFNPEVDLKDTHDGTLLLQGNQYRLKLMGLIAICNGQILWSINEEVKEVYVMDPEENDLFNPAEIFALVDKDFNIQWVSQSANQVTVDLMPKTSGSAYSKIRMVLDQVKLQILSATYFSDDGNQYIINIKSQLLDPKIDQSFFLFDKEKYPGYAVIDMRIP